MTDSSMYLNQALDFCLSAIVDQGESIEDCLRRYPDQRGELEPLLRLTVRLNDARNVQASPDFRLAAAARMRNLTAASPRRQPAATGQSSVLSVWHNFFRGLRRAVSPAMAILMLLVVLLGAGTGVAYASSNSLPGNTFYGVKLAVEQTRLNLSSSPYNTARMHLDFASRRMAETVALADQHNVNSMVQPVTGYVEELNHAVAYLGKDSRLSAQEKVVVASQIVQSLPVHQSEMTDSETPDAPEEVVAVFNQAEQQMIAAQQAAVGVMMQWPDLVDLPGGIPTMASLPTIPATPVPPSITPPAIPLTPTGTVTVWIMDTPWPTGCPTAWPTGWPEDWKTCWNGEWPTGIPTDFPTAWPTYWPTEWATYMPPNWQTLMPTLQNLPSLMPTLQYLPTQISTYLAPIQTYLPSGMPPPGTWPTLPVNPPSGWPTPQPPPSGGGDNPEPPPGFPNPPPAPPEPPSMPNPPPSWPHP